MTSSPSTTPEAPKPETDFETMARDFAHWWFGSDWENDRFTLELAMRFKDFRAAHSLDGHVEKILAMSHDEIRALSIIEGSHADIDAATAETAMYKAIASAAKTRLAEVEQERDGLQKLVYVPGMRKCAKCGCVLVSNNLHVSVGRMSANNEPQVCPNNCGPMWPVTERQAGNDMVDRWDVMRVRAETAETALATVRGQLARSDDAVAVLYESAPDDNPATAITEAIARHKARAAGKGTGS